MSNVILTHRASSPAEDNENRDDDDVQHSPKGVARTVGIRVLIYGLVASLLATIGYANRDNVGEGIMGRINWCLHWYPQSAEALPMSAGRLEAAIIDLEADLNQKLAELGYAGAIHLNMFKGNNIEVTIRPVTQDADLLQNISSNSSSLTTLLTEVANWLPGARQKIFDSSSEPGLIGSYDTPISDNPAALHLFVRPDQEHDPKDLDSLALERPEFVIRSLSLAGTSIGQATLKLPTKVKRLDLSNTGITNNVDQSLMPLDNLEQVTLTGNPMITRIPEPLQDAQLFLLDISKTGIQAPSVSDFMKERAAKGNNGKMVVVGDPGQEPTDFTAGRSEWKDSEPSSGDLAVARR